MSLAELPSRRRDWLSLLQLAAPILVAQLAQVGMGVTDTIMAGRVSATDLAAVAVGFSLYVPIVFAFSGMLNVTAARVSRARGAGDEGQLRQVLQQCIWLALMLSLAGVALLALAPGLMRWMAVDAGVAAIAEVYIMGIAIGVPGGMLFQVLRSFSEGSNRGKPVMVISLAAFLVNIPLNYFYINGISIDGTVLLPAMGGAGCGLATGTIQWFSLFALALVLRSQLRPLLQKFAGPDRRELRALFALGAPIGGALFMEISIFAVVSLLIGHLGATTLASHQIALNLSAMTFMVPFSLGIALTVKVGHALGAGQPLRARRFAALGASTGVFFAVVTAALIIALNENIVVFYNDDPEVRELAAYILLFAAAYQISDALQVTAAGSLRGYHDTRATLMITILAYWGVGLPVGYVLGLTDWLMPRLGVAGFWAGFIAGLSAAALLLNGRLWRISAAWKTH